MTPPSPSLCPLFSSAIHVCQLNAGAEDERAGRHDINDDSRRRIYGNLDMQLNSSRLPLNPNHIATQMREPSCSAETEDLTPAPPVQPLPFSTARARRRPVSMSTRTPTPPPTDMPAPRILLRRRGAVATIPFRPTDTRRHGMVLEDTPVPDTEDLPSYSPEPPTPSRRVSSDSAFAEPMDVLTLRRRASRQRELRELQRQWTVRRRTLPTNTTQLATERTGFRALVSEAYDLPPPYAERDPYPLFKGEHRRPSLVSRVLLYPFVPEGEMLDQVALKTDRWAARVKGGVKTGVKEVGRRVKSVPGRIEDKRAERKIRWLKDRGRVEVGRGRERERGVVRCAEYAGAWHWAER